MSANALRSVDWMRRVGVLSGAESERLRGRVVQWQLEQPSPAIAAAGPVVSRPPVDPPKTRVQTRVQTTTQTPARTPRPNPQPAESIVDRAGSFMASHNIRVVELVAGLLIVVCSVGLVVSLWSTLVSMHRAIPATIFLAANAAMIAAGLHVFLRWRLPQTGRAILVIASLLVPLSVAAGMAGGAGTSASMRLTDPVTIAVIAGGTAAMALLVRLTGMVMLGRRQSWRWVLAVGGGSLAMVFVPAALRHFGASAGWIAAAVSAAAIVAIRGGRRQRWVLPIAGATTAAFVGHFVLVAKTLLPPESLAGAGLPIAVSLVPMAIVAAVRCWEIGRPNNKRQSNQRQSNQRQSNQRQSNQRQTSGANVGSVLWQSAGAITAAATLAIVPAMMVSPAWLWMWAAAWSITAIVVSVNGPTRGLMSCLPAAAAGPIGFAAAVTVPMMVGAVSWDRPWLGRFCSDVNIVTFAGLAAMVWLAGHRFQPAAMVFAALASLLTVGYAVSPAGSMSVLQPIAPVVLIGMAAAVLAFVADRPGWRLNVAMGLAAVAVAAAMGLVEIAFAVSRPWVAPETLRIADAGTFRAASIVFSGLLTGWLGARRNQTAVFSAVSQVWQPVVAATGAIIVGTIAVESWWPAIDASVLAPVWPTVAMASVFVAASIGLAMRAVMSNSKSGAGVHLAAISALAAVAAMVPAVAVFPPLAWVHLIAIAAVGLGLVGRWLPSRWHSALRPAVDDLFYGAVSVGGLTAVVSAAEILLPVAGGGLDWQSGPAVVSVICAVGWMWRRGWLSRWTAGTIAAASLLTADAWMGLAATGGNASAWLAGVLAVSAVGGAGWWLRRPEPSNDRWSGLRLQDGWSPWVSASIVTYGASTGSASWIDPVAVGVWTVILIADAWRTGGPDWQVNHFRLRPMLSAGGMIASIWILTAQFGGSEFEELTAAVIYASLMLAIWRTMRIFGPTDRAVATTTCDGVILGGLIVVLGGLWLLQIVDPFRYDDLVGEMTLCLITVVAAISLVGGRRRTSLTADVLLGGLVVAVASALCLPAEMFVFGLDAVMVRLVATSIGVALYLSTLVQIGSWATPPRSSPAVGRTIDALERSLIRGVPIGNVGLIGVSTLLLGGGQSPGWTAAGLAATSLLSIAILQLSHRRGGDRLRTFAIAVVAATAVGWSMIGVIDKPSPVLSGWIRLMLVGSLTTPLIVWGLPRRIFGAAVDRWELPLRRAQTVSIGLTGLSLAAVLLTEWSLRTGGLVGAIEDSVVVGVAVAIAAASATLLGLAVIGGPAGRAAGHALGRIGDGVRRWMIYGGQITAAAAWVHLYLCRQDWATAGLADRWPWIVLGIAAVSVVATTVAGRIGDAVIRQTLSKTSLYLPLIPAMGFWATKSDAVLSALGSRPATGGGLPYRYVLLAAAIYYVVVSTVFRRGWTKIAAMVFGTGALWLELSQNLGWDFFTHPQAWLIPPAVAVLAVTHLQRDRLTAGVVSSIRYAATLTIYVSSTADMIYAGLGNDLSGPILLIVLALIGVAAGLMLRIGPMLYLGSLFVFVGATAMVVHAGRSLDAVWPWWAFGITTGLLILGGLIAAERYRETLRGWRRRLASW